MPAKRRRIRWSVRFGSDIRRQGRQFAKDRKSALNHLVRGRQTKPEVAVVVEALTGKNQDTPARKLLSELQIGPPEGVWT